MKPIFSLFAVAIIPMLSGCGPRAYKPPPPDQSARLRIVDTELGWRGTLNTLVYPTGECNSPMKLGMIGGVARLASPKNLGMPGDRSIDPRDMMERKIPAGHPILLSFVIGDLDGMCSAMTRITAEPGADYQVDVKMKATGCELRLAQLLPGSDGKIEYARVGTHWVRGCLKNR